jgi:hypothetical protein
VEYGVRVNETIVRLHEALPDQLGLHRAVMTLCSDGWAFASIPLLRTMTANNPVALETGSEIAAFRLDGPQTAPTSPNRGLTKNAHGRVADQGGGEPRPPRRP